MPDHSPETPTNNPQSVGRYRIIRRLGEGGMGSVFLALDTVLNREVALKLPLTGTENDPEVRERFLREARSVATLDHPYICRVYDADQVDGRPYMAMAYIEGKSLADLVRAEGIPPRQVVALVGKLAIAMNEAHLKGVVHRDLKPRNVMIRSVGSKREPVIVDFGLARLESVEDVRMTKTGQILGTPAYMSPEQLRGNPAEIGPACDIYSLGVILYELLTGLIPFSGNYPVMVAQILTQPPAPPSTLRQGLDPALDVICLKAMAKEPSARYASMMELATALTDFLRATPTVSISNRRIAPISRPIETDSIPMGADTLVSKLLGRPEQKEKLLGLGIVLDAPPTGISTEPARVPTTNSNALVSPANEGSIRSKPIWWGLAASGLLALIGIIVLVTNRGNRSKVEVAASDKPVPKALTKVSPLPDASKSPDKPKPVVETPPPTKVDDSLITSTIGMKLKLIPAGEFFMGAADGDSSRAEERPQHKVRITRPFYLGVYEVTQAEYKAVMGTNPSRFSAAGEFKDKVAGMDTDRFPVDSVSWTDAIDFCNKLSVRDGLKPCYTTADEPIASGTGYRLPTEAEWEYACRGLTDATSAKTPPFAFGQRLSPADANFNCSSTYNGSATGSYLERTVLVGSYSPNSFGLFDMHGNVWEFCQDWYDERYYAKSPEADPQNLTQAVFRVSRGGGRDSHPEGCRSAMRFRYLPSVRYSRLGFRVARGWSDSEATKPFGKPKTVVDTPPQSKGEEGLITNTIGMKLKLIPTGEFLMGSDGSDPDAEADEKVNGKKHRVRITKSFYMGTTEVTVGQFRRFTEKTRYRTDAEKDSKGGFGWNEVKKTYEQDPKYTWHSSSFPQTDDHPVTNVSWNDAAAFCDWLSQTDGRSYRLPTEAEWEYCCRASGTSRFSSGNDLESLGTVGNVTDGTSKEKYPEWTWARSAISVKDGYVFTAPVGRFRPNAFGLYDMHGNVRELCLDYYDSNYYRVSTEADPWNYTQAAMRVARGGSWRYDPRICRSADRDRNLPGYRDYCLGFRVARSLEK